MKTSKTSFKLFQPGDVVAIVGQTTFDREVVVYNDPVSFVSSIANKESGEPITNQQFMYKVANLLKEVDVVVPHHNEEAFITALIKAGICSATVLN